MLGSSQWQPTTLLHPSSRYRMGVVMLWWLCEVRINRSRRHPCALGNAGRDTAKSRRWRDTCWTELDGMVNQVPNNYHLALSMNVNARTGVRGGEEGRNVVGAYPHASDSNGTALLNVTSGNRLVLVTILFYPKGRHIAYVQRYCEPSRGQKTC